ncbi:MAG: FmdB family zinc ribbon protein [Burkholderiaceae bacterium]
MPIYAYKCSACGFAKDTLQKLSDPPLTVCPECGQDTFSKQVTAAGFQLKGSGWYVTDFRNNGAPSAATAPAKSAESGSTTASATSGSPAAGGESGSGTSSGSSASGAATPAAAPAQPAAAKPTSGSAPSA